MDDETFRQGQDLESQDPQGQHRRGFPKCTAWAGTGVLWTRNGSIPRSIGLGGELAGGIGTAAAAELGLSQETGRCAAVRMERPSMLRKMSLARNTRAPAILAIALCLSACAGIGGAGIGADYRPVVDMSGHTQAAYDRDVAACQQTAGAVRNNTVVAEVAGMGAGGGDPLLGAGVGGGGYEEAAAESREERIVKNCMGARGYAILG